MKLETLRRLQRTIVDTLADEKNSADERLRACVPLQDFLHETNCEKSSRSVATSTTENEVPPPSRTAEGVCCNTSPISAKILSLRTALVDEDSTNIYVASTELCATQPEHHSIFRRQNSNLMAAASK